MCVIQGRVQVGNDVVEFHSVLGSFDPSQFQRLHALVQRTTQRRLAFDTRVDRRARVVKVEVERSARGVCILQSLPQSSRFDPGTLKSFGLLRVRSRGCIGGGACLRQRRGRIVEFARERRGS